MPYAISENGFEKRRAFEWARLAPAWPAIAFLVSACATLWPILANLYLPLIDLPNHIARFYIAAAPEGSEVLRYYEYSTPWMPNSAADLIWGLLGHPGDPARFAQILMGVYAVNLIFATMVLSRVVHKRWSVWPAAAGLLVYSAPFFWGFQNFLLSLPFCLYGIALWLGMEKSKWRRYRVAVFLPFAGAVYMMHIFGLLILAIAIFGREVQCMLDDKRSLRARGLTFCVNMLPFALPVAILIFLLVTGPENPGPDATKFGVLGARFWALVSPLVAPANLGLAGIKLPSYMALVLLAVCFWRLFAKSGIRLVLDARMKGPVIALALAALLAPVMLKGAYLVHIRIPVLLVALLLASTHWRGLQRREAVLLCCVFGALIAVRGIEFDRMAKIYGQEVSDMAAVTEALPQGARVLPLRTPGREFETRYYHMQGHLVHLRDAFVPTLFQGTHSLKVQDRWKQYAAPVHRSVDMRWLSEDLRAKNENPAAFTANWNYKFTHALLMDELPSPNRHWQDLRLIPVKTQGRFTLYSVVPSLLPEGPF